MKVYLYSYSDEVEHTGVGYLMANSRSDAAEKLDYVIDSSSDIPFGYTIEQELTVNQINKEILNDKRSEKFMAESMYPNPSEDRINHLVFAAHPKGYCKLKSVVRPPEDYLSRSLKWLEDKEYYEMCKNIKDGC